MIINSEIIYTATSKKFGLIGYLVIDRLINGRSFGGVRMVPNISIYDLQLVARKMTLKNAFIGNKIGGAKAAIIVNKENKKHVEEILFEFGKCISPLIKNGIFLPVLDMGMSLEQLNIIFKGAQCKNNIKYWKNNSHIYTGESCFNATLSALEKRNINIQDATFAIEGFGRVGNIYAGLMYKAGARLTAFSNKYGGLIDENGFDVDKLIQEKISKGDEFILDHSNIVSHSSILEKDVTILLPAAEALVINTENYKRINADIIVCAANSPMTDEIERLLFEKGKIVITDFIANCGGVLGSNMDNYVGDNIISYILSTSYKRKVDNILSQSSSVNKPPIDMAIDDTENRIGNMNIPGISDYVFLFTLFYPIKKIINKYMSNIYISKYEKLWQN